MAATVGTAITQARIVRTAIPGPRSQQLAARRAEAVSAALAPTLPFIEAAEGAILLDVDGNQLIDFGSGIAVNTIGHAAPAVTRAVAEAAARFTHTCFMVSPYESYVAVCEELNRLTPGDGPKRSVLFNSGAEAVENAVKVARHATGRQAVVTFEHGYHGRTNLTMAMTAKNMPYKHRFGPFAPEVYRLPMSYPFRDGGLTGPQAARRVITRIDREIGAENLAAIVIEPIQGEGGFVVPAAGFLPALAAYAGEIGAVFVSDEVQTGFCRTGDWFASEHEALVPDLITTAKGIAAGLPLAGLTGRADLMDAIHTGGLGGTYSGNPVACAAALASIATMTELDLNAEARRIEAVMMPRLQELAQRHRAIGDIRGRGAMLAVELVAAGSLEPDAALAAAVNKACHAQGLATLTAGTYGNVLRFLPPLVIGEDLLDEAMSILADAFARHTP